MKARKKLISVLVAFAMCISMIPVAFAATPSYEDVDGHWAEEAILRWSEYGVLEGSEGLFAPDQQLTRGQLAAILSRLLDLKPAESAGFADVDAEAWYAEYIDRCAAAGIMKGSEGMARPNDPITREETMVMLGRALNIKPAEKSELDGFHDKENVSDWAAGYVAALTSGGIINGVDGALVPQNNIDRASTATILHRAIGAYANEAGQTVEAAGTGIVIVTAPDVTVTGSAGSVLVTPGAEEGTVTLTGAAVDAGVTVTAEKATVIVAEQSTAGEVTLTETAAGSKVVVLEGTSVGAVTTQAANSEVSVSGKVESVTAAETAGEAKVEVTKTAEVTTVTTGAAGSAVTVAGKVDTVATTETAGDAKVEVSKGAAVGEIAAAGENTGITVSGKVDSVTVADTASNTTVEANKGSTISKVDNAAEGTTVSGSGKVENVTTSGDNTTVSTPGTKVDVSEGTSGTTAGGKDVEGGSSTTTKPSTPSGGGSSGGGDSHSHSYAAEWSKDADYHWHVCVCGAVSDKAVHTWNAGEVTKEATCTEKGVKTYTCSVCGATKTEEIPATGHTEETIPAKAPTCTETGLTEGKKCSVCGEILTAQAEIAALGHEYENCVCTRCDAMQPEAQAAVDAWAALNTELAKIIGNNDAPLAAAERNGSAYTLTLDVDAIQAGNPAVGDDVLNGLATKLKEALDAKFGTFALTVDGLEVYDKGDFQNTALKNALFSVADGFFYTLANMTRVGDAYTYKTVDATVGGDHTYTFSIAVQLKGEDVAKVQSLARTLADHLQMEKLSSAQITDRYSITVNENEAVVVTMEMPDALMQKAASIAGEHSITADQMQNVFDTVSVGQFLEIMSQLELSGMLGSNAADVESVLATVNSNANAVNKVLSKLTLTVTDKDNATAQFGTTFTPGTEGTAWQKFMSGVMGMSSGSIASVKPGQFKVAQEGQYKDVYYAVPVTVQIDLESSMGFQATETVVVVLHIDFSLYTSAK